MTLEAYFDERADTWDETAAERDGDKLAALAGRLGLNPGDTVLDVGTGTGVLVPYLLKQLGSSGTLVGVDLARQMLRKAAGKRLGPAVNLLQADIMHTPLRSESCDAVVCYSSFPHFRDKLAALCEVYRVLRPGGRLAIAHTSGRERINARHGRVALLANDLLPDEAEMRGVLAAAGFTDVEIEDLPDRYLATAWKPAAPVPD